MELSLDEILRVVPHRPPFLLLDRVQQLEPPTRIVALKTLHADDPWFVGHFPDHPIFPGVLLVEALAQAGAVLAAYSVDVDMGRHVPYLVGIEQARVRKPVYPGHTLELRVTRERGWGAFWRLQGEARVDGDVVASAGLMAALVPRSKLPAHASAPACVNQPLATDIVHAGS